MNDLIEQQINSLDVFYISYDEPNAEENWADLIKKVPWAKRVHGIKGFDAAHKACAEYSDTDHFITVDGDNKVLESFFDNKIEFNPNWVYSWGGKNYINSLIYGNGGLKLWPRHIVLNMRTHEQSDEGIEFCWDLPYYQMNDWYSISYNNASPFQAFRVGFREGVKLSLLEGKKTNDIKKIWHGNMHRLLIWMTVGADIENGIYAIYGSRLGCYMTNLTDFNISNIADYNWFDDMWQTEWIYTVDDDDKFKKEYNRLCKELQDSLDLPIANLGRNQSKFFKSTLQNPVRMGLTVPEKTGEEFMIKNNFINKDI